MWGIECKAWLGGGKLKAGGGGWVGVRLSALRTAGSA